MSDEPTPDMITTTEIEGTIEQALTIEGGAVVITITGLVHLPPGTTVMLGSIHLPGDESAMTDDEIYDAYRRALRVRVRAISQSDDV